MAFSDYLVFLDESGDHGIERIDPNFPVFVLAACLLTKDDYANTLSAKLSMLKMRHWGHDLVVLHASDIRQQRGAFAILTDAGVRAAFRADVLTWVGTAPATLVAAGIDKPRLVAQYARPENPYHLSLRFCLQRCAMHLPRPARAALTHVIAESRGTAGGRSSAVGIRRDLCRAEPAERGPAV